MAKAARHDRLTGIAAESTRSRSHGKQAFLHRLPDQANPSGSSRAIRWERSAPDAGGTFAAQEPGRDFGVPQGGFPSWPKACDNEAVLAALGSAAGQPGLIC